MQYVTTVRSYWRRKSSSWAENYERAQAELEQLAQIAQSAYLRFKVMENLLQFYRAAGEPEKAVDYARELYVYDPRNSRFQAGFVEAVLDAALRGEAGQAELQGARTIAVQVRNKLKNGEDKVAYWDAIVQVHELSLLLNEPEKVQRALTIDGQRKRFPWMQAFTIFEAGLANRVDGVLDPKLPFDQIPEDELSDGEAVVLAQRDGELVALGKLSARIDGFAPLPDALLRSQMLPCRYRSS